MVKHHDKSKEGSDHTPGRTHTCNISKEGIVLFVTFSHSINLSLQDALNKLRFSTVNYEHYALFHEGILKISGCFLKSKKAFFSRSVRQVDNALYDRLGIIFGHFKNKRV